MEKGSYSLLIKLEETKTIEVGSLGSIDFKKGYYAYNGSAFGPGGLSRIKRHKENIEKNETKHWHIDYLLTNETTTYVGSIKSTSDIECELSKNKKLNSQQISKVQNFGSSDCGCNSHLLYSENLSKLRKSLLKIHKSFSDEVETEFREKRKSKE